MSSRFPRLAAAAATAALIALSSQALAQSDDSSDPQLRIEHLEDQLRQVTGQNEELQHRNRLLEDQLRQLQGGAAPQPGVAAAAPAQPAPGYGQQPTQGAYAQPQPGYQPPGAAPAPMVQETANGQGRGDAFDPSLHPNAPGAPRPLGGGGQPMPAAAGAAPVTGAPLDLAHTDGGPRYQGQGAANGTGGLTTAPPMNTPRDEYDLGIGYMQHKDYALAEQTMRNFVQKYPNDPMVGESQYWVGESLFQRQQYRDAAEAFLAVTTKYDKSAKAPDALLRLGQSLAALKQKEAACATFGEVGRKYPRASAGVKAAVDREQKRQKC